MIAVDANLLVYALREDSEFHEKALSALLSLSQGQQTWAIPWPCGHKFLAIATHPRIYKPATPMQVALDALDVWRTSPDCRMLHEVPKYWDHLRKLLEASDIKGPMVHDARVAAICLSHKVSTLWTADRDFSLFPKLTTHDPLKG